MVNTWGPAPSLSACSACWVPFALSEDVYYIRWAPGGVVLWESKPLCHACWQRARMGMSNAARAVLAGMPMPDADTETET